MNAHTEERERDLSTLCLINCLSFAALAAAAGAQNAPVTRVSSGDGFDFTIRNIMRGPELYGRVPTNPRWSANGKWIYFQWNAAGTDWREPLRPYRARAEAGASPERITTAQSDSALPYITDGARAPDDRSRVVDANGDLYLVELREGTARRPRSSPIYFAEGLRAPLLMAHGMVDVNVMYQDIVRLEQRLIELGKTDWTLASYPVEDHSFVRPSSWSDEYRRIFELFETTIARPANAAKKAAGDGSDR